MILRRDGTQEGEEKCREVATTKRVYKGAYP